MARLAPCPICSSSCASNCRSTLRTPVFQRWMRSFEFCLFYHENMLLFYWWGKKHQPEQACAEVYLVSWRGSGQVLAQLRSSINITTVDKQTRSVYTMQSCPVLKGNKRLTRASTRMDLENIRLSEKSQAQRVTCCVMLFSWSVQEGQLHRDRTYISVCQRLQAGEAGTGFIYPSVLKSYKSSVESAYKLKNLEIRHIIVPHYGMLNKKNRRHSLMTI